MALHPDQLADDYDRWVVEAEALAAQDDDRYQQDVLASIAREDAARDDEAAAAAADRMHDATVDMRDRHAEH